ncbi:MAG: helix-turn-helix transcriptional regulator [Gammaproteobacteria bacterium]|nr:helix-turn-helix transcriptional regulator [Gammaproteobacteria bacterium]MCY4211536.1 helix-turn-helix transcriptional regulator [Gammaproteobacteria bacterium]MCY4283684.1 helix-turn-helix transcriptional regulator [Gammaproteobacteria bacterium]MCY4339143.1 helix-turn-helix transcriptional regulator [Gammaproteobacteria bacterium]
MKSNHTTPSGGNVFADLNLPDAENLRLRSELMVAIRKWVKDTSLTQAEAAQRLDTTQPILNDVIRGRYDRFTIDRLVNVLDAAGLRVSVSVRKAA